MKAHIILSIISIFWTSLSFCQVSSHYWSHQYGAKGQLLNGAVIASVEDETAIFYNPGALGLTEEFGISVSLISPVYAIFKTDDFLGQNTSFKDRGIDLAPGLVAAMFRPFGTNKITVGLTTFSRFKSNISLEDRVVKSVEGQSDQIFLGDVDFRRNLSETWVGLGVSFRLHEKLSIGLTQFSTWRGERVSLNFRKEILNKNNPENLIAGWRSDFEYGYSVSSGVLTKFGLCWQPFGIKVGATLTTATYGAITKDADYAYDYQKIFTDKPNTASSNDQSTKISEYSTPWSVGLGLEIPIEGSFLSISAEYFNKVKKYNLINDSDDPFDGQSQNPQLENINVKHANNQVFNIAIGIERSFNEKYTWFYGFRTDFSPESKFELGEGISFLASTPNIYHLSTGGAYDYRDSKFSVGFDYGFGFKTGGKPLTDISNINLDNIFTFSGEGSIKTWVHQFSLYLSYDL
ncbi:MAG: hypothetical protein V3V14_10325 [Saprospiraceae bacterium]